MTIWRIFFKFEARQTAVIASRGVVTPNPGSSNRSKVQKWAKLPSTIDRGLSHSTGWVGSTVLWEHNTAEKNPVRIKIAVCFWWIRKVQKKSGSRDRFQKVCKKRTVLAHYLAKRRRKFLHFSEAILSVLGLLKCSKLFKPLLFLCVASADPTDKLL